MKNIIVKIKPESRANPMRVSAATRAATVTIEYRFNLTPRLNAMRAAIEFALKHHPESYLGPCRTVSRYHYKFPIIP